MTCLNILHCNLCPYFHLTNLKHTLLFELNIFHKCMETLGSQTADSFFLIINDNKTLDKKLKQNELLFKKYKLLIFVTTFYS